MRDIEVQPTEGQILEPGCLQRSHRVARGIHLVDQQLPAAQIGFAQRQTQQIHDQVIQPLFDLEGFGANRMIALGNGLFLPNLPSQVGDLYARDDPRRGGAYNVYYVGVNLGALIAPLVCGTLGEVYGWHWGFGAAGVGMCLGLAIYLSGQRHLPPDVPWPSYNGTPLAFLAGLQLAHLPPIPSLPLPATGSLQGPDSGATCGVILGETLSSPAFRNFSLQSMRELLLVPAATARRL